MSNMIMNEVNADKYTCSGQGAFASKNVTFTIGQPKIPESVLATVREAMQDSIRRQFATIVWSVPVEPLTTPKKIPTGWPPDEEPASVIDEDGVKSVMSGGTPMNDQMRAFAREWYPIDWKCNICGTCNPGDPCIPGAYF